MELLLELLWGIRGSLWGMQGCSGVGRSGVLEIWPGSFGMVVELERNGH